MILKWKMEPNLCFHSINVQNFARTTPSNISLFISRVHLAAVVKVVKFLSEVVKDFRMACHIRCKDQDYHVPAHLLSTVMAEQIVVHLLELLGGEVGEDVALGGGEDLEGDSAMVVLQWGHVIVPGEMLISSNKIPIRLINQRMMQKERKWRKHLTASSVRAFIW